MCRGGGGGGLSTCPFPLMVPSAVTDLCNTEENFTPEVSHTTVEDSNTAAELSVKVSTQTTEAPHTLFRLENH